MKCILIGLRSDFLGWLDRLLSGSQCFTEKGRIKVLAFGTIVSVNIRRLLLNLIKFSCNIKLHIWT